MLPHLLGVDIALLTLCWAHAFACMLEINMYREEPLILLIGSAWLFTMLTRMFNAVKLSKTEGANFYTERIALLTILCLAVGLALLWLLLFAVSTVLLHYVAPFAIYLIFSRLPFIKGAWRLLLRSVAYAFCCAIPSFYFSVTLGPFDMLSCAPIWYLGVLMFFFFIEPQEWRAYDICPNKTHQTDLPSYLVPCGQFALLLICIYHACSSSSYEQSVSTTLILANACLAVVVRLRKYVSPMVVEALRIPVMMIAPILSVIFFGH